MTTSEHTSKSSPVMRRLLHPSIKRQLHQYRSEWELFCSKEDLLPEGSNKAMKNLLQSSLSGLNPRSVWLVIDDIDHMTVRARETFLYLLLQMWKELQGQVTVRILVTSRPYSDIGVLLEKVPTILQYREYKGVKKNL